MKTSLFKNTLIYATIDAFFKFINFFTFPIFSHIFTVEQFGILSLVTTFANLINHFICLGLNNGVQRYYFNASSESENPSIVVSTALLIQTIFSISFTIICIITVYNFKDFFQKSYELSWIIISLALFANIPGLIMQFCSDVAVFQFAAWKLALILAMQNAFGIFFPIFLIVYFQLGIEGFLLSTLLSNILLIPLGIYLIRQDLTFRFNKKLGWKMFYFSYPFIFASMGYWFFGSMDRWMLGNLSGITEVGIYNICFKISIIQYFCMTAFARAWSPYAVKIFDLHSESRQIYSNVLTRWSYFQILLGCSIASFSLEILMLLTPPSYWEAARVLPYVSYGLIFYGISIVTSLGITLSYNTIYLTKAVWITACVNFILNWFLIPPYGAMGAGISSIFSCAFLAIYYMYYSQKFIPIPLNYFKLSVSLIVFSGFVLLNEILSTYPLSKNVYIVKIFILGFFVFVAFWSKIFLFDDIVDYYKLIRRKLKMKDFVENSEEIA